MSFVGRKTTFVEVETETHDDESSIKQPVIRLIICLRTDPHEIISRIPL